MHFKLLTYSRDDQIHIGETLGHVFRRTTRERPWMVTLGDAANSGKSLLVLAADSVMNPRAYPYRVQPELLADVIIYERPRNSLAFLNDAHTPYPNKQAFDARLSQLEKNFPAAKVIMCANMQRGGINGPFNYAAEGLQSDRLDMHIDFEVKGPPFERRLSITTEDPVLYTALQRTGFDLE